MDPKYLIECGDELFSKRSTLVSMWQDVAENFYPERADFTVNRSIGDGFADDLMTSYPVLIRRDLGNSLGSMMRPTNIEWFKLRCKDEQYEDVAARQWLEWATGIQRRAMYDRASMFKRASKEADHDMAAFGQSVKTVELNREANGLLFRNWHLRDVAWAENSEGKVATIHRKWKPAAATLCDLYRDRVHPKVAEKMIGGKKKPFAEINCRHIVLPSEMCAGESYAGANKQLPFVEITLDADNMHIMEMVGLSYQKYIIPRWQTVSGNQYSFSPATVVGLPDARLLQSMVRTVLEAGEKFVNPPMVAVQEAIRGDVSIYAGGITWVDSQYDERLGEVLRPLTQDKSGAPLGLDLQQDIRMMLSEAFFLNKLNLPQQGPEMTAYEVGQRVQEYIRHASPLFEPLEDEDNAATCEAVFDLMLRHGAFGRPEDIPQSIRGTETEFRFESPLHDAIERQKGQRFQEAMGLLSQTIPLDETASAHFNIAAAFRDVTKGLGVPAAWMRTEEEAEQQIASMQEQRAAEQMLQQMAQGAEVAKTAGEAEAVMA
jgi:Bacteriophage head to tail connecting protein